MEKIIKHDIKINVMHQDILIGLFIISIGYKHRDWPDDVCKPIRILSFSTLIGNFIQYNGTCFQSSKEATKVVDVCLHIEGLAVVLKKFKMNTMRKREGPP